MNRIPSTYRWIGLVALLCLLTWPAPGAGQAVVGRVIDVEGGAGVRAAQVSLIDPAGSVVDGTVTDDEGQFRLPVLDPGMYSLRVEHIAYATTTSDPIRVDRNDVVEVELRVSQRQIELEPLVVTARREAGNAYLSDFYNRAERNEGIRRGVVLTRQELERYDGMNAMTLFNRQGVRFRSSSIQSCLIRTYWNGLLVEEVPSDQWRRPGQAGGGRGGGALWGTPVSAVEGIEIYDNMFEIPPQYYEYGVCGVVLVWSRPIRPREGQGGSWLTRGALAAGVFAVLAFVFN